MPRSCMAWGGGLWATGITSHDPGALTPLHAGTLGVRMGLRPLRRLGTIPGPCVHRGVSDVSRGGAARAPESQRQHTGWRAGCGVRSSHHSSGHRVFRRDGAKPGGVTSGYTQQYTFCW